MIEEKKGIKGKNFVKLLIYLKDVFQYTSNLISEGGLIEGLLSRKGRKRMKAL